MISLVKYHAKVSEYITRHNPLETGYLNINPGIADAF